MKKYLINQKLEEKKTAEKNNKNRRPNIIWLSPPLNKNISTNVARRFSNLIDKRFPKDNKPNKIFNRNSVKVSYSCTEI